MNINVHSYEFSQKKQKDTIELFRDLVNHPMTDYLQKLLHSHEESMEFLDLLHSGSDRRF